MQQIAESYHSDSSFKRVVPSYVVKFTLYCTPDGQLIMLIGNQYLQVTADEARGILESTIRQAAMFNGNGHNHDA